MKSKIGFLFIFLFVLNFYAHSQSDSSWFSVKIVNQSQKKVYINFLEQLDSIKPQTEANFRRKIMNSDFPLLCFFAVGASVLNAKFINEYILSDTIEREVRVSQNDSVSFISNYSEKLVEYYNYNHTEANFIKVSDTNRFEFK